MKTKIKIYKMSLSRVFPATHPRAGEPTYFEYKIRKALGISCVGRNCESKLHTIRAVNPNVKKTWFDKIKEVQRGEAVLVLYQWDEKPYSKDGNTNLLVFGIDAVRNFIYELLRTEKYKHAIPVIDSGIGVQKTMIFDEINAATVGSEDRLAHPDITTIAENDGLSVGDFKAWFKGYDLSKPLAIIQFTTFRY
jgi:hypothetical protein